MNSSQSTSENKGFPGSDPAIGGTTTGFTPSPDRALQRLYAFLENND